MESSFRRQEVFPLIARLIIQIAPKSGGYLSHDQIVSTVLSDDEGALITTAARSKAKWDTDRQVASNMVAWFSQQISTGMSSWADFFDRERQGGAWAYRPKTTAPVPIADDVDVSAIEGQPLLFFHVRRERSPALRKAKRDAVCNAGNRLSCEACGLVTEQVFPGLADDILEVHHRLPLSASDGTVVTTLEDLVLLCPNCHRAIHRTKPMLSVEQFRIQVLQQADDHAR